MAGIDLKRIDALWQVGLDLLFPPRCAGCQRLGERLCAACLRGMQPWPGPLCNYCGRPVEGEMQFCPERRYHRRGLSGLRALNRYGGELRRAIHALKYEGQQRLAGPLGQLLAQAYRVYGLSADALIPLPLHPERERQRGFNQATLLARVCADRLGLPCLEGLVIRQRMTRSQVDLNWSERQQNMLNAFALSPQAQSLLQGYRSLMIIDDVSTSGATLEACAAPLYRAGVEHVWGLVLGRPDNLTQDGLKML